MPFSITHKTTCDHALVLYDVSSSYYTGRCGGLVKFGYSRDRKRGFPQIVYGLLCNAGEVQQRSSLPSPAALRSEGIRKLVDEGIIEPSLFDERDLAEVISPDYPGERLMVCRNPLPAHERARKRNELLACTQKVLDKIVTATRRVKRPLRGKDRIGLRVGKDLNKYKVGKHFVLNINADSSVRGDRFDYRRDEKKIAAEAALDGLYVIRTFVPAEASVPLRPATGEFRAN